MATLRIANKANQAESLPVLLAVAHANASDPNAKITIDLQDVDELESGAVVRFEQGSHVLAGTQSILDYFCESKSVSIKADELIKEWLQRLPRFFQTDFRSVEPHLLELDYHLILRSYVVGYVPTLADFVLFGAIRGNRPAAAAVKKGSLVNLTRWFTFLEESNAWITPAVQSLSAAAHAKKAAKSAKGASYDIALEGTEKGVLTRFPPEPSGYLHIGHAKAALLNDYFAHEAYKGTMLLRFDDTNPSKEKEEFEDSIIEDLALMGIRPDRTSHSSDYFQEMHDHCVKLIEAGDAYADDTEQEIMREERFNGIASARRVESVEDNLKRFSDMTDGTPEGQRWCIRAKISVDDPNKAMRDPVIYRCNLTPHHRTGSQWKAYPTYDFCAPFLDSIEGVTHALRTNEYRDRNPQYEWMQKTMHLRPTQIWDFARMNFIRTLLSKRKLTKFVDTGKVWGWDDPRFPTVRGIRRRGMTIAALREFMLKQGPSRNIVNMDWNQIWATNKKFIDPVSPRHTAIDAVDMVTCTVRGARNAPYFEDKPKHGKNADLGNKKVVFSPTILIEQEDAQSFSQDEEITLMNWGNAIVREITHSINPFNMKKVTQITMDLNLQGDVKTTSKKITWLSKDQDLVPVEMVDFDYLITKDKLGDEDNYEDFLTPTTEFHTEGFADCNTASLSKDDIIQFERKGYFRVDEPMKHGKKAILFAIPTGKIGK